jgi:hypothetical protein
MTNYIYNDEDNAPMLDPYVEPFEYERKEIAREREDYEAKWNERIEKERQAVEGLADMLELTGDCRKCPDFTELAEGFLDDNGLISIEQFDFLKMQCSICGGKGTGKPKDEQHEKWRDKSWQDIMEWVKGYDMKFHCLWCPNVYRIYGQYKDPDDEWNAIENLCMDCKYFGED